MISTKLRDGLAAFAVLIMIAGPAVALLVLFGVSLQGGVVAGRALGNIIEMAVMGLLGGGVLRLLVSIDARLEART